MKKEFPPIAKKIILSATLVILTGFVLFYVFLPAINLRATSFWVYLTALTVVGALPFLGLDLSRPLIRVETKKGKTTTSFGISSLNKWALIAAAVPLAVLMIGSFISSEFFNARRYADIIEVEESNFSEDLPESNEITNIALMDTASATILGKRAIGHLSHVVSQYVVSPSYTQINYQGAPRKVANLEYDGFFKWMGNRQSGIPGMVMVDPVKSDAKYMEFDEPMYYAHSAYFNQDLERRLRFLYPTKIFDSFSFEVDEQGNPYYVISCVRPQVALFGAYDVTEVIIFNPCDGTAELFAVEDAPSWIDIVYNGNLATQKYNWHGTLSGGFLNSIIGNVGCKQATDDFGYIALGDDVWYFTGVTSVVSDDKSNIGFILTNARTGAYKFYGIIGAEEHSAMSAAEGEVQEKGYIASFPSLVNVSGQATYIMVLKDDAGLVKLYALVNVENYSIVATGATQADAMSAYKKLLKQNNIDIGTDENKKVTVTVENVRIASVSDVATVYVTASDGVVYKGYLEADEGLILIRVGDTLQISYTESDLPSIRVISEWEFVTEQ